MTAIDIQALSEAAIKAKVDDALAGRDLVVFLVHGGLTAGDLTKICNVIDYAAGLGIRQGTFYQGMSERTVLRGSAGMSLDASGRAFYRSVRTNRIEISREDQLSSNAWLDIDETTDAPTFDAASATVWQFKRGVRFRDSTFIGLRQVYGDGVINNGSTTLTSATAGWTQEDVGRTITATGVPVGTTIVSVQSATQVTLSAAATATASSVQVDTGRPATAGFEIAGQTKFFGVTSIMSIGGGTGLSFRDLLDVATGTISPTTWSRAGVGGTMTIDSGTGGSNIEHKGFRHRFWDHAGARKIALCTAAPTDASIANGEGAIWFDTTAGAVKIKFKAKQSDGTVRNGEVALA